MEVRQQLMVWAKLQAEQVPFRLKEFLVTALWRKLLVAQSLNSLQVLSSVDCPLCGVPEDHPQLFKKCFFLKDSLALVRRLWGCMVPRMPRMSRPECAQTIHSGCCPPSKGG